MSNDYTMSPSDYTFYMSAAEDEVTVRENRAVFQRVFLRPKVLVDVSKEVLELKTTILGESVDFPLFISPCAECHRAHVEAENGISEGVFKSGNALFKFVRRITHIARRMRRTRRLFMRREFSK